MIQWKNSSKIEIIMHFSVVRHKGCGGGGSGRGGEGRGGKAWSLWPFQEEMQAGLETELAAPNEA